MNIVSDNSKGATATVVASTFLTFMDACKRMFPATHVDIPHNTKGGTVKVMASTFLDACKRMFLATHVYIPHNTKSVTAIMMASTLSTFLDACQGMNVSCNACVNSFIIQRA